MEYKVKMITSCKISLGMLQDITSLSIIHDLHTGSLLSKTLKCKIQRLEDACKFGQMFVTQMNR